MNATDAVALLNVLGLLLITVGAAVVLGWLVSLAVGVGAGLLVGGLSCLLLARAAERP